MLKAIIDSAGIEPSAFERAVTAAEAPPRPAGAPAPPQPHTRRPAMPKPLKKRPRPVYALSSNGSGCKAATLTKWEYTCANSPHTGELTAWANQFGAQGWEMVTTESHDNGADPYCFKRPKM